MYLCATVSIFLLEFGTVPTLFFFNYKLDIYESTSFVTFLIVHYHIQDSIVLLIICNRNNKAAAI